MIEPKCRIELVDKTQNFTLAKHVEIAAIKRDKITGLMHRSEQSFKDRALIFVLATKSEQRDASIHMLFMKFPIDVLFLDENFRIIDMKFNVEPWTGTAISKKRPIYIIEIRSNSKTQGWCKVGDKLGLTFVIKK